MNLDSLFTIALHDLSRWRKMPLTAACALIPPIAMMLILATLSIAVTQQPVALVIQSYGPASIRMANIIISDSQAYYLTLTNSSTANMLFDTEQVAAIITIPPTFAADVANGTGTLQLRLNNVDYDFADDIRRSVERSAVEFDAPALVYGISESENSEPTSFIPERSESANVPNAYHVYLNEAYVRQTDVDLFHYQLVPTLILLVLSVGLVGTALLCAQDEESKTARMLALSPQRSWTLVFGRMLGGVLACFAIIVPAVLLCALVGFIRVPIAQIPALFLIFLGTSLCAAGLGAIIGTSIKGQRYVAFCSSIAATYLFLLGGGFGSIELVPQWLRTLSAFIPTRYAIDGIRQALFYPNPTGLGFSLLVLALYSIACVALGAFVMRRSLAS